MALPSAFPFFQTMYAAYPENRRMGRNLVRIVNQIPAGISIITSRGKPKRTSSRQEARSSHPIKTDILFQLSLSYDLSFSFFILLLRGLDGLPWKIPVFSVFLRILPVIVVFSVFAMFRFSDFCTVILLTDCNFFLPAVPVSLLAALSATGISVFSTSGFCCAGFCDFVSCFLVCTCSLVVCPGCAFPFFCCFFHGISSADQVFSLFTRFLFRFSIFPGFLVFFLFFFFLF